MARIEYSPQLRLLFNKFQPPVVNLAESIELAGLSISTLRRNSLPRGPIRKF